MGAWLLITCFISSEISILTNIILSNTIIVILFIVIIIIAIFYPCCQGTHPGLILSKIWVLKCMPSWTGFGSLFFTGPGRQPLWSRECGAPEHSTGWWPKSTSLRYISLFSRGWNIDNHCSSQWSVQRLSSWSTY